jgi:hypothetical protein
MIMCVCAAFSGKRMTLMMMMTVMGESRAQVSSLFSSRLAQEEEDTW